MRALQEENTLHWTDGVRGRDPNLLDSIGHRFGISDSPEGKETLYSLGAPNIVRVSEPNFTSLSKLQSSIYLLHTDVSNDGLGAVLYQQRDNKLRVIGYGSRTLTPAERNYHLYSGKLKFLALR